MKLLFGLLVAGLSTGSLWGQNLPSAFLRWGGGAFATGDCVKLDARGRAISSGVGCSSGTWGSITGTLSSQTDLQAALNAKQSLDSDLTAIAALSCSNTEIIKRSGGVWTCAADGGSGGTPSVTASTGSAGAPVFTCPASAPNTVFTHTLTANATPTFSCANGTPFFIKWTDAAGGHTVTYGVSWLRGHQPYNAAGGVTVEGFIVNGSGVAESAGSYSSSYAGAPVIVSNATGNVLTFIDATDTQVNTSSIQTLFDKRLDFGTRLTYPTLILDSPVLVTTPAATFSYFYVDPAAKNMFQKNSDGNVNHGIRTSACGAGNHVSATNDDGTVTCSADSGGGGGVTPLTTSGQGEICIPFCGGWSTAQAAQAVSKTAVFYQFTASASMTLTAASFYVETAGGSGCAGGNPCGMALAVYNAACTAKIGTDFTTSTSLTTGVKTMTGASISLVIGTVYHFGFASDSTALKIYGPGDNTGFQDTLNAQSTKRYFKAGTATGDNGGLAMPSNCTTSPTAISAPTALHGFLLWP